MDTTLLAAVLIVLVAGVGVVLIIDALHTDSDSPLQRRSVLRQVGRAFGGPLLGLRVAGGIILGVGALLLTRWPVAAVAVAGLVIVWPRIIGAAGATRDRVAQLEALALWTESLKDLVSGATGLYEAIPASVASAPAMLLGPLGDLTGLLEAREPMPSALLTFAEELADPSADMVIAALIINAETRGPGLAASLDRLAGSIREELELRRSIDASRRGGRRSVQIMMVSVLVMAAMMAFVFPPQFSQPYRTGTGQLVLLVIIAVFGACFFQLRRLGDADVPDTFLTDPGSRS